MAFSDDLYRRIDEYLENELSSDERRNFEQAMSEDEELAKEVALQKEIQELLADTPENELRQNLKRLNKQVVETGGTPSRPKWQWGGLLLLLIPIIWWWFYKPGEENIEPPIINQEHQESLKEDNSSSIEEMPEKDIDLPINREKDQAPAKIEKTKESKPNPPTQKQKDPGPIAANFDLNPSIEFLISNNLRSDDIEWSDIQKPQNKLQSSGNASIPFRFSAKLQSSEDLTEKKFKLHLFSNKEEAFDNFEPLTSFDLNLNSVSEGVYSIDFQVDLSLTPGLYYYLIEDYEIEKIHYVNKFELRD